MKNKEVFEVYLALNNLTREKYPFDLSYTVGRNLWGMKSWFDSFVQSRTIIMQAAGAQVVELGLASPESFNKLSQEEKDKVSKLFKEFELIQVFNLYNRKKISKNNVLFFH